MTPEIIVEIGGLPVAMRVPEEALREMIARRYANFTTSRPSREPLRLTVETALGHALDLERAHAIHANGKWIFERNDFEAEWLPERGIARIRQLIASPYPSDSVLRMIHSIVLASRGGFLLHASSSIRDGCAFAFSGISGAGKTTMARLAPTDVALLTDEMSYISPVNGVFHAFGTPFAGDLGVSGENVSAPLKAVYLLSKGPENKCEPVSHKEALAVLLRNILFFATEPELVNLVFQAACRLVDSTPVYRLTFAPTPTVWEMIR